MSKEIHRRDFLKVIPGGVATLISVQSGVAIANGTPAAQPSPLRWDLSEYRGTPGLTAAVANDVLTLTWDGDRDEELRLRMTVNEGTPTIQDLAVRHRKKDESWITLASNVTPEFRVVSGYRRMTQQQMTPLHDVGVEITPAIIAENKWNAFWDAPLVVPGTEKGGLAGDRPPLESAGGQPGLPRKPEEVNRATAVYQAQSCEVKSNGARLEITFPGVQLGKVFSGRLQYTLYKGINLIRQEVIAKTEMPSVAYKYDAGLKGLAIQPTSRVVWRNLNNQWLSNEFGGPIDAAPMVLQSANRLAAAEVPGGSIATFPPPHNFFWQSELAINLGNSWYSKDSDSSFAFGVREAETQADPIYAGRGATDTRENWALRNARPGTWQRMPVYFYVGLESGQGTIESALAFTRGDHYKPLPGYQVMATHFHTNSVPRLLKLGGLNAMLPDYEVARAAGINIFGTVDSGSGPGATGDSEQAIVAALVAGGHAQNLALAYEAARLHSDKDFVVMPNEEIGFGRYAGLDKAMGGHNDLLVSHPVYWNPGRAPGQPLVEEDPKYGKVYHIGSPADLMEMTHHEDLLIYMPHPRAKGSTGLPDSIKDTAHFQDANWRGIGFRWGLGVDGSEVRFSDYRCQPLFDDMNNWVADLPTPPKYIHVISEFEAIGYEDDFYANNPVDYIRLDKLPGLDDWKPIIYALKRGDYFTTSGEVLIPSYAVEGTGNQRRIVADVEWTFPLDFAEVVWGDGEKTDRQIISATNLPAFGRHHFQIPFDATGKKWVRFAVWDSAGNGAMVQPIKLTGLPTASESASR
jgi:hypothetical protein